MSKLCLICNGTGLLICPNKDEAECAQCIHASICVQNEILCPECSGSGIVREDTDENRV